MLALTHILFGITMLYRWLILLREPSKRLGLSALYATCFAIGFAFAARLAGIFLPANIFPDIRLETLEGLLNIISSTMFAVSTFALSIMVSAFASASSSATPRATHLVIDDAPSRRTIASFISAFIYAVIAKTALGMDFYEQNGRFVLFLCTILVLAYVIITLISWVSTLSQLGRLGHTLDKIHSATATALQQYRQNPAQETAWQGSLSENAIAIYADQMGYLTHINLASLQALAEQQASHMHICVRAGELITPSSILVKTETADQELADKIRHCFIIAKERSFDQDPNWGFIVFSEVAQRALSPAVNDPGTALKVLLHTAQLLITPYEAKNNRKFTRLSIVPLDFESVIDDCYSPICRDGGAQLEVQIVLQKSLATIWQHCPEPALALQAKIQAENYLERAKTQLTFTQDREKLVKKHQELFGKA
ncbi:DUF2254 domain-containing protein [Bibersteinia trehalosi]|nr:DUF2254 family protein [Bibersteinia trehalosi]